MRGCDQTIYTREHLVVKYTSRSAGDEEWHPVVLLRFHSTVQHGGPKTDR